jgi:hypothetical protein
MSPTIAKPPKPLRLNQKAVLVPAAQYARWHEIASATPGLSALDRAILDIVAEHHRGLQVQGVAGSVTIEDGGPHRQRADEHQIVDKASDRALPRRCPAWRRPAGERVFAGLAAAPRYIAVEPRQMTSYRRS